MISMGRNVFLIFIFFCVTMLEKTCTIDIDPKKIHQNVNNYCHYFRLFLGFNDKNGRKSLNSMVNGTMSIYKYVDNWNNIHMVCDDKQNNVCLRQLVAYRKIMCVYAI